MRTVAILDHYAFGHHLAFTKLFAKNILKLGYRVCIFYPNKRDEILKYLTEEGASSPAVYFEEFEVKKRGFNFFGRLNNSINTFFFWQDTRSILRSFEKKHEIKFDIIFFSWLDDYLSNDLPHQAIDAIFPYRWSGLYFHPWYLYDKGIKNTVSFTSIDSILRSKNCVSIGVHDEFVIPVLSARIQKKAILFPEIADISTPANSFTVALQIREKAKGRMIVGLIGMEKRKGVIHFLNLLREAEPTKYFFFLAGNLIGSNYSTSELDYINRFLNAPPENLFYYPHYIDEGEKINAVINSFDVLFLVYDNFKSSSNFNTKAAFFKKVVLATNKYWIGQVTEKYNMGITVEEGNTQQATEALERLRHELKSWDYSKYESYCSKHEEKQLLHSFEEAFNN